MKISVTAKSLNANSFEIAGGKNENKNMICGCSRVVRKTKSGEPARPRELRPASARPVDFSGRPGPGTKIGPGRISAARPGPGRKFLLARMIRKFLDGPRGAGAPGRATRRRSAQPMGRWAGRAGGLRAWPVPGTKPAYCVRAR